VAVETVDQVFLGHLQVRPQQACLYLLHPNQPDRTVSYQELGEAAAGYARAYAAAGIQPGEVVILILQHGLDLVAAFWGAVLHGAIPSIMPFLTEKLLPDRYRKDLAALFQVTRPAAVVTYPDFAVEAGLSLQAQPGETSGGSQHALRAILYCSDIAPSTIPGALPGSRRDPRDIVFLQHSSGTTGLQKGVAISHAALLNQLASYRQAIQLSAQDVIVSWLPLYHDMGLITSFLMPILEGVPLVLMSPVDWVKAPYRLMQAISQYRGTLTWLPNFAYNFCAQKIRDAQIKGVDLSSLRSVINCSEPAYANSMRMFAERFRPYGLRENVLSISYAMAENVFGVTQSGMNEPFRTDRIDLLALQTRGIALPSDGSSQAAVEMVSCGPVIPGTQVRVLDPDRKPLPERRVGEIAVHSDCMLTGYFNRPDATAQSIYEGWYLTGDYGYVADGEVYVTGRKKDLIIVGGRNIFPQDIEAAANEVKGVHPGRTVAFGLFNEDLATEDVALIAEVELGDEQRNDPQILQAIEDEIRLTVNRATAVSLRYVHLVGPRWLVKTSSGKIARSANREKFLLEQNMPAPRSNLGTQFQTD
jgi:acyl-CoA synthetase (AMP-forming)/AMP-acid ligase II